MKRNEPGFVRGRRFPLHEKGNRADDQQCQKPEHLPNPLRWRPCAPSRFIRRRAYPIALHAQDHAAALHDNATRAALIQINRCCQRRSAPPNPRQPRSHGLPGDREVNRRAFVTSLDRD
uniref:Uncharacterized protein n=1 Tax=Chelativorans sp. (strain BNC1) TaxID=266779 RepID=Q11BJ2_CHESB